MFLYHGTDINSAEKICAEKKVNHKGLWCTNDPQLALTYGECLVCVHIEEGSWGVEVYPLSTGKLTDTIDWRSEPMEFMIVGDKNIECNLYYGDVNCNRKMIKTVSCQ